MRDEKRENCITIAIALSFSVICIQDLQMDAASLLMIISLAIYGASTFRLFGHGPKRLAKSKCYSTYELVEVVTYDTHYDEVRRYQCLKLVV